MQAHKDKEEIAFWKMKSQKMILNWLSNLRKLNPKQTVWKTGK